jgi:hypothetical protein
MSRSRRKTPIIGMAGNKSEKKDKKIWHSRMRARERDKLKSLIDPDNYITTLIQDVSNVWNMTKDGKCDLRGCLSDDYLKEMYYMEIEHASYFFPCLFISPFRAMFKIKVRELPITKDCRKYINRERAKLMGK